MNMHTSKCLSLCFLVAAATSTCGEDQSCAEDALVALQTILQIGQGDDSAQVLDATEDYQQKTKDYKTNTSCDSASVSRRRRNADMCSCRRRASNGPDGSCVNDVVQATTTAAPTPAPSTTTGATATCVEGSVRRRRSIGECACRRRSEANSCINNEFVATCGDHVCQTGWVWRDGVLAETNPDEAKCCEEACPLFTTAQTCPGRCSWSGTLCEAPSCDTYSSSACPSDRCKSSGGCKDQECRGIRNQATCEASPKVCGWTADTVAPCTSQFRIISVGGPQQGMLHGTGVVRPQYRTAFHKGTATGDIWKGCSSTTNCWGGTQDAPNGFPTSYVTGGLTSSAYTVAAVEVFIDCKITTNMKTQRRTAWESNVNLQAWYNDIELDDYSTALTSHMRNIDVPVTAEDDPPIFRVEARRGASSSQDAAFKILVTVEYVSAVWDRCMDIKDQHSQCLSVFADIDAPLRSDHPMQIKCLDGTDTSPAGCSEWLTCLGDTIAKATLLKVLEALAKLRSDLLLAQDKPVAQALVQSQRSTGNCKNPTATETCADPDTLDVEAYDCDCLSWVESATDAEITDKACDDKEVCCAWKETHCTGFTADPMLLQRSQGQENLTEKGSQEAASLDESLSGKRDCR